MEYKNEPVERRKIKTNYKKNLLEYLFEENYVYDQDNLLLPCGYFWPYLAKINHPGPRIWVPDTFVVSGQSDTPSIWIYSGESGCVQKTQYRSLKDFATKLCQSQQFSNMVAICKKPIYRNDTIVGNDIKLIRSQSVSSFLSQIPQNMGGVFVIQRFIKCSGQKPYICRTVWRNKGTSESFLITSHNSYNSSEDISETRRYVVKANSESSTVRVTYGQQVKQTMAYVQTIAKYFRQSHGVTFSEIMADFIKDQSDTWWLVNVKGFLIQTIRQIPKAVKSGITEGLKKDSKATQVEGMDQEKQKYQKTKTCKYCEKPYLESLLSFKMTLKMIILTDRYLLHRGKTFKWLQRSDINNIEIHSLYQEHRVCERCYKLHTYTKQLMDIEVKYAQKLGIALTQESKYNMVMNVGSKYLEEESKNRQVSKLELRIPDELELGPYSKLTIQGNCPIMNDQIINQMIRYRFIINLVSIDQVIQVDPAMTYYLEYSLVNIKVKYKLEVGSDDKFIQLNKLRVVYAFCHDRKQLNEFIAIQETLAISLICENQKRERSTWGKVELPLAEFMSDKIIKREYYKMFNLKDVVWGWGLTANIGVSSSNGFVDTSRNIFKRHQGLVYYPENPQYFACEPLHSEWISMLREQKTGLANQSKAKDQMKTCSSVDKPSKQLTQQRQQNQLPIILECEIDSYMKRPKKKKRNFRIQ